MATEESCDQLDLGPRRVGIHFRKLACRSDAVDEVLTDGGVNGLDFGARARSTGPPHEKDPGHPGRLNPCFMAGRVRRYPETALKRTMTADGGGPTSGCS
jgi:hypothetical protein